jgi:tetratricopeptide (TPR) repeat protein
MELLLFGVRMSTTFPKLIVCHKALRLRCSVPPLSIKPASLVPVLLLTALFEATTNLSAHAVPEASMQPTKPAGHKPRCDAYGLPPHMLDQLILTKRTREARAILAKTPRVPGDDDVRRIWTAACFTKEQRYEDAVLELNSVENIDKATGFGLHMAAIAYMETGDCARALPIANRLIQRGDDTGAYDIRARIFASQKRYAEAASDYEQAAMHDTRRANDFYVLAANTMLRANRPSDALTYVNKAPLGRPGEGDCNTFLTKASCLRKLNRLSEAVTALTQAIEVCRKAQAANKDMQLSTVCLCHALQERILCYEKLGQTAKAAADRQTAAKVSHEFEMELIGRER